MANVIVDNSNLTNIANAIRSKNHSVSAYKPSEMAAAVLAIDTDPSGDATATENDILSPKTAYANGAKLVGTIRTKTALDVTSENSIAHVPAGYYAEAVDHNTTSDATATAGDILDSKIAYSQGQKVTGNIPTKTSSDITVNGAIVDIPSGYYANNIELNPTSDANATLNDILITKSAYVNGIKVDGNMPNHGSVTDTISTLGGTKVIQAGYTSGGIITASITPSELSKDIISGVAYEEATGDYAWKSTVAIPAGYHNAQTLEKTFSDIFPAPATEGTATELRLGYQLFNHEGKKITGTMTEKTAATYIASTEDRTISGSQYLTGDQVIKAVSLDMDPTKVVANTKIAIKSDNTDVTYQTGTMTNNGAVSKSLAVNETYTIPAGYHNGSGKVTQSVTTKTAATYNTSTSDLTITASLYLTGAQTIKGVTFSNLDAANIKSGVNVKVGDSNSAGRLKNLTGTFTSDGTVTSNAQLLKGYIAYSKGVKYTGTIETYSDLS